MDGVPVSEAAVAMWTEQLRPLMLARDATFFEATTAMAFADFAARGAEIAVVEVGLGGRLDSTNVVTPVAAAVTSIARDHEQWLGTSLEAIAREKAGIAKRGVPFVIGERDPAVIEVLRTAAEAAGALPIVVPADVRWQGALGLAGAHQRRNAAVAAALLGSMPEPWRPAEAAVAAGFESARLPGRFDRQGRWLFDVAHNPDGVAALTAELRRTAFPRPLNALIAILGDKDWRTMLGLLEPLVDQAILGFPPSAGTRAWLPEEVAAWINESADRSRWRIVQPFPRAVSMAGEGSGTTLVTGSFHTVGDAMAELGLSPAGAADGFAGSP